MNFAGTSPQDCTHIEHIQNVLRKGKIDPAQETRNKEILTTFLEDFTNVMRNTDRYFNLLFQRMYYTGSFYENLRISDPNEFDINLVLNFPFRTDMTEIEINRNAEGFAKYKLKAYGGYDEEREVIINKFFENGYLIPLKVRTWIQSVVDRALLSYRPPYGVREITPSGGGPAKTMFLETIYGYQIDIDLVPVLQMSHPAWPQGARRDMLQTFPVPHDRQFWFLVPKEFSHAGREVNAYEAKQLWRIHLPEIEKEIIHDRGCVKPVIKLLKALKHNEHWEILASYYMKTVVMWLVEKNPSDEYWSNDKICERLFEALQAVKKCVSERMIKYYFYPTFNLIEKIGSSQACGIRNRLESIIRDIESNPARIEAYFTH